MGSTSCSLSIMVARTDLPFMMQTIPHLVKMCDFPFLEKVLFVDTAPLSGEKLMRPGIGTLEQLRACCQELLERGVVDRVVDIDYSWHERLYRKHFGLPLWQTHNYKGYPIFGSIFSIEAVKGDYVLHFDSDMLLYQQARYSWVEAAIALLQRHPEAIAVRPLSGPPRPDGSLHRGADYERDPAGFYRFKFFGSRVYLIERQRFDRLLPLPVLWRPARTPAVNALPNRLQTWFYHLAKKGSMDSWEVMVSRQLERTPYIRVTMDSPQAWTLHPAIRSPEFLNHLPEIIGRIEAGWYPEPQAGHYDLQLQYWLPSLVV